MFASDGDRVQTGRPAIDWWIAVVNRVVNDPRRGGFRLETFRRRRQPIEPLSET